jgi:predicted Zn-dependent peptidase
VVPEEPTEDTEIRNAQAIREYKKLMDEGIITAEEFEAKKKQLLGL